MTSHFRILVVLGSTLFLTACGDKEVVAWPGMDVTEFNRLNKNSASKLNSDGDDWIGINSPVTFVFRQGDDELRFSGTRRGGGMQVASSDLSYSNFQTIPPRVTTIAFNIGDGMESIASYESVLAEKCSQLARMAGVKIKPVPNAAEISGLLRAAGTNQVEVCGGDGPAITYQISAFHYDKNGEHGGDYGRAFLDGSLHVAWPEDSLP